jgi:predicted Rdx family selenoprotein
LWGGFPNAKPLRQFLREVVVLEQLAAQSAKQSESDASAPDLPVPE